MLRGLALAIAASLAICASASASDRPLVAIIDGGVARTAELQDVLIAEYDFAAQPSRPAFQPQFDHGTYVATVLHRAAKGGVDIVSLRIDDPSDCAETLNPPCQPEAQPVAAAIYKAVSLGADAINISLALKSDPTIVEAIRHAAASGVRVVLAAGNNGADRPGNRAAAIAGYPNTVLVGALDTFGEPWVKSNRPDAQSGIDYNFVWRPGVDVATTNAAGSPTRASGTSIAAPMETAFVLIGDVAGAGGVADRGAAPSVTPVADKPPIAEPEATTASSATTDAAFTVSEAGMLLHILWGFALAVALYPAVSALKRRLAARRPASG